MTVSDAVAVTHLICSINRAYIDTKTFLWNNVVFLAVIYHSLYLYVAPAKSGAGIGILNSSYWRHNGAFAPFLCRVLSYTSMAGRTGASQDAPVSNKAGNANSVRFRHP
ncbi:hypothetical protein FHN97_05120 [Salmonella enterica]|uniref:ash family protein n=1 Tax=Salmonella enterica TaxID=28901 RepID=UPI0009AE7B3C|nr:ash family protein [Salmonella enterica]ECF7041940.1 hypothetical protein [Salmonella enterica subsp. enterica]EBD0848694.1 hypothetical protein [Salmonella enterica]EBF2432579.1 hypothetical protein [Salmonella enterica]EBN7030536.1 hypothetical protein [Salmonella enterica]ECE2165384.1 hypothetical protein [Salmonella enterica]